VPETIPIDRISTEGTQTRAELNQTVIDEYADAYEQGVELPPIDVYIATIRLYDRRQSRPEESPTFKVEY
jgi:hypothetical protein